MGQFLAIYSPYILTSHFWVRERGSFLSSTFCSVKQDFRKHTLMQSNSKVFLPRWAAICLFEFFTSLPYGSYSEWSELRPVFSSFVFFCWKTVSCYQDNMLSGHRRIADRANSLSRLSSWKWIYPSVLCLKMLFALEFIEKFTQSSRFTKKFHLILMNWSSYQRKMSLYIC